MSGSWDLLDSLRDFLNTGGDVLWVIFVASICLWTLVVERFIYFKWIYPEQKKDWLAEWESREDRHTQQALTIRRCLISEAKITMGKTLPMINVLVALCPLLGLLGTVTGMIHVFDVMSVTGSGNPRAMASGVSQATIPTMAGMVIAIGGLYFSKQIKDRAGEEIHHLTDLLKYH